MNSYAKWVREPGATVPKSDRKTLRAMWSLATGLARTNGRRAGWRSIAPAWMSAHRMQPAQVRAAEWKSNEQES
jgi:hypothetical protein